MVFMTRQNASLTACAVERLFSAAHGVSGSYSGLGLVNGRRYSGSNGALLPIDTLLADDEVAGGWVWPS